MPEGMWDFEWPGAEACDARARRAMTRELQELMLAVAKARAATRDRLREAAAAKGVGGRDVAQVLQDLMDDFGSDCDSDGAE